MAGSDMTASPIQFVARTSKFENSKTPTMSHMTPVERESLAEQGYLVIPDFFDAAWLSAARAGIAELFEEEGDQAGSEFRAEPQTQRLANCVDKGEIFEQTVANARIREAVATVIPEYKLSSLNVRSANPHSDWVQPLHCDVGAVPDEKGYWVCNVIIMIDDFTTENGATRCVPGSHKIGQLPQNVIADVAAPHPDEILVTGKAGTVVVMNAHLWHGGTANKTGAPRCAIVLVQGNKNASRGWRRQQGQPQREPQANS